MIAAKLSSPPCAKDGVISAWALTEPRLGSRLLQKDRNKTSQEKELRLKTRQQREKLQQLTKDCIIIFVLALEQMNQSIIWETKSTRLGMQTNNKEDKHFLIRSPRSMLHTTWLPRGVLNLWGFLVADTLAEALSLRTLMLVERGARGTRCGTYSTYWSSSTKEPQEELCWPETY
jgi:hypothetical protein